jgi:hypothetical protein
MQQSLRDNATLIQRAFAGPFCAPNAAAMSNTETDQRLTQLDVRAASLEQEAGRLSGGNQQKVIVPRWLARNPQVLVFGECRAHQRRACLASAGQSFHSHPRLRPDSARSAVGELHQFCFKAADAQGKDDKRISDINAFVQSGDCNALTVSPNTTAASTPAVARPHKRRPLSGLKRIGSIGRAARRQRGGGYCQRPHTSAQKQTGCRGLVRGRYIDGGRTVRLCEPTRLRSLDHGPDQSATDRHAEVYTRHPRTDRGRINRIGILDAYLNEIEPEFFDAIDKIKSRVEEP